MGHMLADQLDFFPGLRISADARRAIVQAKTAKAANFDTLARRQAVDHLVYHTFDRQLDIFRRKLVLAQSDALDQFGFGHLSTPREALFGALRQWTFPQGNCGKLLFIIDKGYVATSAVV